jgi:hypothetical protein
MAARVDMAATNTFVEGQFFRVGRLHGKDPAQSFDPENPQKFNTASMDVRRTLVRALVGALKLLSPGQKNDIG